MENLSLRHPSTIYVTLLLAFLVSLFPLGQSLALWRPEWVVLVIIHWCIYFPNKISYVFVFFLGLLVDTVWQMPLGQHSLAYMVVMYTIIRLRERISPNSLIQHLFMVLVAGSIYLLLNLWVLTMLDSEPSGWGYWLPLLSNLIVWPLITSLLRQFHIAKERG